MSEVAAFTRGWRPRVEKLLTDYFDESYLNRFRQESGSDILDEFLKEIILNTPPPQPSLTGASDSLKSEAAPFNETKSLISEIKDAFLIRLGLWDFSGVFYFTVTVEIVNTKPEPNTIKKSRLLVKKRDGEVEGELLDEIYLKDEPDGVKGPVRSVSKSQVVLAQGVPFDYSATFKFIESENQLAPTSEDDDLADKVFTVILTDSYNIEHRVDGRTSKEFVSKEFRWLGD